MLHPQLRLAFTSTLTFNQQTGPTHLMIKPINDHSQEDLQNVYCDTPQKVVEEAPGFFSCATLKVAQVNLITGLMYGYMIGYVGVYSTMYDFSTRCSDYKSRGSCTSLQNANCDWVTEGTGAPYCGWVDQPACKQLYFDEHSCEQVHRCTWDYGDKKCGNEHGYTAVQKGVFAGAMTVGGIVGNIIGGQVMVVLGPKRTFLAVGVSSLLGGVLYHVSIAVDSFWCLCVSRLVVGVACGAVCIAAPHVRCAERCAAVPGQHRGACSSCRWPSVSFRRLLLACAWAKRSTTRAGTRSSPAGCTSSPPSLCSSASP
eukprot:gene689-biopygen439